MTNPVFEILLVPVMQSCQQERDPGRVQGGSSCGALPGQRRGRWGWNGPRESGPKGITHPDYLRALGLGLSSWVGKL